MFQEYYHQTIRKYVIYFGALFNDIHINRVDANNNSQGLLKIPLSYAPRDKMLARIEADPNLDRESALSLPRMSFELTNMFYDGDRALKTQGRVVRTGGGPTTNKYIYNEAPFNFNFTLYVYVKHQEDGTRIVEQILPYFKPEWNASLNMIPELNIVKDVPIQHMAVRMEDRFDDDFTQRRVLIWTLDFMLKGYLWGPEKEKPIINFANVNFFAVGTGDTPLLG